MKQPAPIPLLSLKQQYKSLRPAMHAAAKRVLDSGVFILGPEGRAFEAEFAKTQGVPHAVGMASGTDALVLSLKAVGVGPGDEVIVPTFTFIATATAVSTLGATPVFADVDAETLTLSAESARRALSPKTKAVLPVHLFGQPADMDALLALSRERGLKVVEDCAQAHMARYKGRPAGALGHVGAFSFYPSKNLGAAGDAGLASTTDAALAETCLELRNCGRPLKGAAYHHPRIGYNSRLDELQAALLRVKLKKLSFWTKRRQELAALYAKKLAGLPLRLPPLGGGGTAPVFHLFVVRAPRRDELAAFLKERGIGTGVYYPIPVHKQPAYAAPSGGEDGRFPVAEEASRTALALPMFPELTAKEVERVCRAIREFFAKN